MRRHHDCAHVEDRLTEVKAERDALRAEVASLRDDVGMWRRAHDRVNAEMLSEVQRLQRELREARALLAEGLLCCGHPPSATCSFCTTTRAFLDQRRDDVPCAVTHCTLPAGHDPTGHARAAARRCTCTDFKHDDPFCPARDKGER